ncbi:phage tail protein [Maritalea porphyrae]|uniref:phage tail protein n=1 Tax=Maritalea porphyrae TaxID=880732 RepID=UPI0022AEF467|nr:phage tail protein [Maritalea porphyrae]MCZ4272469.1 phage tail protein [Maritalea porphyrae]
MSVLYQMGALQFTVAPINADKVAHKLKTDFARKAVFGGRKPSEHTGEGDETIEFSGKVFPSHLGGEPEMDLMNEMRRAGVPHFLMRGDGRPMGWFEIDELDFNHTHLQSKGVGRVIEIRMTCTRVDAPSAVDFAPWLRQLVGLFSGLING